MTRTAHDATLVVVVIYTGSAADHHKLDVGPGCIREIVRSQGHDLRAISTVDRHALGMQGRRSDARVKKTADGVVRALARATRGVGGVQDHVDGLSSERQAPDWRGDSSQC